MCETASYILNSKLVGKYIYCSIKSDLEVTCKKSCDRLSIFRMLIAFCDEGSASFSYEKCRAEAEKQERRRLGHSKIGKCTHSKLGIIRLIEVFFVCLNP